MQARTTINPAGRAQRGFLVGVVMALTLVVLGALLIPATSRLSILAAASVLILYGVIGWLYPPRLARLDPRILRLATFFGLCAALVFAGEIVLEYILLPTNNTLLGYIEFGSVFCLYCLAGVVSARQTQSIRRAILTALSSAMLSALIWLIVVLATFYLFRGTSQQAQVFRAEGNYEDFARSGMHDFNAFILEDFMGAAFFHLLLGPIIAAILGTIGGVLGKGLAKHPAR
ncbi:MAG: hypothetical protein H0X37_25355 [Herpetosiphonaceae bacterium]|nr:hypothetical protein [Herpetosiphonaceae bacterium]